MVVKSLWDLLAIKRNWFLLCGTKRATGVFEQRNEKLLFIREINHSGCLIKIDFRGGQRTGGPVWRLGINPGQNDSGLGHTDNRAGG